MSYKCKCGREFENPQAYNGHKSHCKPHMDSLGKKVPESNFRFRKKSTKGKQLSEEHRISIANSLKGKSKGIANSEERETERKRKISDSMKKNPLAGGLRDGSGRGKKGWYKNYFCDSTWELAWVIYNLENGIIFRRNYESFEYKFDGKIKKYYPDFIIDDVYYEIKGRRNYKDLDEQTKEKIEQFKGNLIVLFQKEMKQYLDYSILKYGKDFYKLYNTEV